MSQRSGRGLADAIKRTFSDGDSTTDSYVEDQVTKFKWVAHMNNVNSAATNIKGVLCPGLTANLKVTSVQFWPSADVTSDNTNCTTITVAYSDGAAGGDTTVATANTATSAGGGTGNLTADTLVSLTVSTARVPASNVLKYSFVGAGDGGADPDGTLIIEAELDD